MYIIIEVYYVKFTLVICKYLPPVECKHDNFGFANAFPPESFQEN